MAVNRPQLWCQLCFNADPNDVGAVPLWTDYTTMVRKIGRNRRGRQYELAQSIAAQPIITWRDPDEIFNPANTSSPQYPNVQPFRQTLFQAMWPNGGTGNLINTGRWRGNNEVASDPSFEAYTNGAALPNWLTAVGGTVATVTTTNPQQGTKSLTYPVVGTATRQGVSWQADCVPGQQYTTSAYVRQSTASTQRLLVADQTLAYDNFGRTASNGWGTADFGGAWTNTGGAAGDFSVNSGLGKHAVATLSVQRYTSVGSTFADANITAAVGCPTRITGVAAGADNIFVGLVARYIDASNHYLVRTSFDLDGNLGSFELLKRVAGVLTSIGTPSGGIGLIPYSGGQQNRLRLEATGTTIRAKLWRATDLEPVAWGISVTDTDLANAGGVGFYSFGAAGVTNTLPVTVNFDNLMCSGSTATTTTTTTAAYVRLTSTFTATQPKHTVSVSTLGTAVAGTVNIDAVQHEPGAVANAFTTSGPVIYPGLRDYIERWPREYEAAGFVGIANTPAVDGFAALNAISIETDYVTAVRATLRQTLDFYWQLDGGQDTTYMLESSGSQGPALYPVVSPSGAGTAATPAAAIGIAGDSGATGIQFTGSAGATGTAYGALGNFVWPLLTPSPGTGLSAWWGTAAAWIKLVGTPPTAGSILNSFSNNSGRAITYMSIYHDTSGAVYASTSQGANTLNGVHVGSLNDGRAHFIAVVIAQDSNTTLKTYVDGVLLDTSSVSTASLGGIYDINGDSIMIGGLYKGGTFGSMMSGVVAHANVWQRELTAADILTLYQAGIPGNSNELTGTRVARHLATPANPYTGATRISAGSTTLRPPTYTESIDLLSDAQAIAVAEGGTFWIAPDGAAVFEGRQDRWLRTTPLYTFGEDVVGGEIPYLDGILFDYDPAFVTPNVRVTRTNGGTAQGGLRADVQTATRRYFGRTYAETSDYASELQAQSKADWTFYSHRAPIQRVSTIIIDPSSNTSLWPAALSFEVGQRVRVKRRAKAANSGAGLTMSADYFIESVDVGEINMDTGVWLVGLQLSPIGLGPDVTFQPWVLENVTYGVLNSTTVLGW